MTEPECYVVVHHPSAGRVRLSPGDLVGRLRDAALYLEHPQVSEVHAYVSLRDGALKLLSLRGERPRPLAVGDRLTAGAEAWEVVEVPAVGAGVPRTLQGARLDAPLRIEGWFDAVHIHREGGSSVVLAGAAARLLCELGAIGQPVAWATVGRVLWPGEEDTDRLRRRWDVLLIRLRRRLSAEAVRNDLVHSDGAGHVQLLLQPDDRFVDRS